MRHRKRNRRFGRQPAPRKATVISLAANLIKDKRIETTLAKAKEAKRLADKIITWGKKGMVHHRRLVYSVLADRDLVDIVFKDLAPLFANRHGGYTRIIHTRTRPGDATQLAILEWTEKKEIEAVPKKKAKKEKVKAKPEAKKEQAKPEPKVEAKHEENPQQKGFLGGLRRLFKKKDRD